MKLQRSWMALAAAMCMVMLGGCSSFSRAWSAAEKGPAPKGIEGRWQGEWRSEASDHSGELRCVIEPIEGDRYLARFHAKYAGILSGSYEVELQTHQEGNATMFEGESDLGKFAGGVYKYEGSILHPADPKRATFYSTYKAASDHGVFEMSRPVE